MANKDFYHELSTKITTLHIIYKNVLHKKILETKIYGACIK